MAVKVRTIGELRDHFLGWLRSEVVAGRSAAGTLAYYTNVLKSFIEEIGPGLLVRRIIPFHLEERKVSWHRVQAAQRLFNWGVAVGLVETNPFKGVERPRLGSRCRTLDRNGFCTVLRACRRPLRDLLLGQRFMLARPGEPRSLLWSDYRPEKQVFLLDEFKGKRLRADRARWRILPVAPRLARLLIRLSRHGPSQASPVFLNSRGEGWTPSALVNGVRRAVRRAGLDVDQGESIVAYTIRHTAATEALANGVSDRMLTELLGHTDGRTTSRYLHPTVDHLRRAIEQATARPSPPPTGPSSFRLVG